MRVVIVGAGIGGLTLARSLQAAGIDFVVLEQAAELTAVGAGIQLSPNGVRVLERLGLAEGLARIAVEPRAHEFKDWQTGETVLRTPLAPQVEETFGAPYYHVHRADLLDLLLENLDRDRLRLASRVERVEQNGGRVTVTCDGGRRYDGEVAIGADGIHSVIRDRLFRPGPPKASGYVAWRGLVERQRATALGFEERSYIYLGPRMSLVAYYVSMGAQLNWIAIGKSRDEKRESWSQQASREEVLSCFDGWHGPARSLIAATAGSFVTALHDREPLSSWISGRVALLGDACHAMLPYHAQGAVQSIEDAWVLARCLELDSDPRHALRRYEQLRKDRAQRIVVQSRKAEESFHYDDPLEVAARNERYRSYGGRAGDRFTPQQVWLFSYDAEKAALGTDDEWRALRPWDGRSRS